MTDPNPAPEGAPAEPPYHDWLADEQAEREAPTPLVVRNHAAEVARYGPDWSIDRALGDLLEACRQNVHEAHDLVAWRGPRLIAVIKQAPDRGPVLTRFV